MLNTKRKMFRTLRIKNFKSIVNAEISLGRINIFIGANGSGKSNILEAIAMISAAKSFSLNPQTLVYKGVRVTKPGLTISSFIKLPSGKSVEISLENDDKITEIKSKLNCNNPKDIYATWSDEVIEDEVKEETSDISKLDMKELLKAGASAMGQQVTNNDLKQINKKNTSKIRSFIQSLAFDFIFKEKLEAFQKSPLYSYMIFNIDTNTLRGIQSGENYARPLGKNGEGLDVFVANMNKKELKLLNDNKFSPWLKKILIDKDDKLKVEGHKLGLSTSRLYFVDRFMRRDNNVFSAENANEGALHVLFYLALFISDKTPSFFSVDNIDNTLNPSLCTDLIKSIAQIAKANNKQALITTHNPSVLDGLNLFDDEQRLFVVSRKDNGHTKVERILIKPHMKNKKMRLSQLFTEGYLGGLNKGF